MKKLIIVVVVVLGLLIAADYAAATAAEYQVSQQMRAKLNLNEDPSVKINGFPFLTQAISGDYSEVTLQASGVPVQKLHQVDFDATLHHLHAPLGDLLNGSTKNVRADELEGTVKLHASDIGKLIDMPDLAIDRASDAELKGDEDSTPIAIAQSDKTKAPVKLTGTTTIAGISVKGTVIAVLSLEHGKLKITPNSVSLDPGTGSMSLPPQLKGMVMRAFTTTLDPGALPFAATPTEVSVENGALGLKGVASNVMLNALAGASK